jgi:hypothetical protein
MHHTLRVYVPKRIGELYEQLPCADFAQAGCIAARFEKAREVAQG